LQPQRAELRRTKPQADFISISLLGGEERFGDSTEKAGSIDRDWSRIVDSMTLISREEMLRQPARSLLDPRGLLRIAAGGRRSVFW